MGDRSIGTVGREHRNPPVVAVAPPVPARGLVDRRLGNRLGFDRPVQQPDEFRFVGVFIVGSSAAGHRHGL